MDRGVRVDIEALDFGAEGCSPDANGKIALDFEPSIRAHFKDGEHVNVSSLEHNGDLDISVGIEKSNLEIESFTGKIDYAYEVEQAFEMTGLGDLDLENDFVMVMNDPTREYYKVYEIEYDRHVYDGDNWLYLNLPIDEVKALAIASIKDNTAMYFSCDVGKFLLSKKGTLDINNFDYESLMGVEFPMNKEERVRTFASGSSHAMTLIAVDLDDEGNAKKWMVENSWGASAGWKGNLIMTDEWFEEYQGDNGTALTDTLGTDLFLMDFNKLQAMCYTGVRHDSGDPFEWGEKIINHYIELGIDPKTKTLLFSDSLDFDKAQAIYDYFKDRINVSFGIGTFLSNDAGVPALNIVIKLQYVNGHPVAKLSDVSTKAMCQNDDYLDYLHHAVKWRLEEGI